MPDSIAVRWYVFLTLFGAADFAQQSRHIDAAHELRLDMIPAEVLTIMGEPDRRYEADSFWGLIFLNGQPKHWLYGETLNLSIIA